MRRFLSGPNSGGNFTATEAYFNEAPSRVFRVCPRAECAATKWKLGYIFRLYRFDFEMRPRERTPDIADSLISFSSLYQRDDHHHQQQHRIRATLFVVIAKRWPIVFAEFSVTLLCTHNTLHNF